VFIPILFINKHVQILYTGLALTVTFSLVVSFFVAITVVPLLASWVPFEAPPALASALPLSRATARVPGWAARPAAGLWAALGAPVWRNRHRFYRRTMAAAVRRRYAVLLAVAGAFLVAGVIYSRFLEKDFMGSTEQDEFIIFVELPAGAKLEISDQVVADVEKVLSETPEIKDVVKTAAARVEGWSSKVYVTLVPQGERKRTVQEIIDELRPKVVDLGAVYDSFIYFSEPSSSKEFIIDVFGYDYEKLRDLAVGIAERLQKIKGLEDVKLRYKPGQPEIRVTIDKDRAALFGFTVSDIAETLHAQIRGLRATYFYTDSNQLETVARLQEQDRKTLEDVYNLTLISPEGELVPIKQVADFHYGLTPSEIWRKDKQRMIQVSANRSQMALGTAGKKTRAALAGLDVPQDYYYQLGGDYQQMLKNEREFRFAFVVMAILVFIVLACLFESYARPLLIMLTVPLAVISVVPVLLVTRTPVTMGVYLGFILLGGLVVTNAIILLDRLKAGPGINPVRTVMTAGRSRLRAIALVQLTTIVDLFPMIWDTSPSSPLWSPLAIAVVGGITGATVLTLFVVPACYLMIRDWERWKRRWAAGVSGETSSVGVTP
jgi:hydrophobic/amphiphilic exporter-1 (mainly G- bacteria), HAE1 family